MGEFEHLDLVKKKLLSLFIFVLIFDRSLFLNLILTILHSTKKKIDCTIQASIYYNQWMLYV